MFIEGIIVSSESALPAIGPLTCPVYVVTKAGSSTCPRGWVAVTWNTTGAQGPAGPTGAQGPAGPAGLGIGVTASGTHVLVDGGPGAAVTVLSLTGAVSLNAGDTPTVICSDANSNHTTQMGEGNLSAVLVSSSKGTSAAAQPSSRPAVQPQADDHQALVLQRELAPWEPVQFE
jgi:hypothetical protein